MARAMATATSLAGALDLPVNEAVIVHNSNKLALRLLPCDVFARVALVGQEVSAFEIEIAQRLVALESPVAALEPRVDPRVYEGDGFALTFWTYYDKVRLDRVTPVNYAALQRLHAGMQTSRSQRRTSWNESQRLSGWSRAETRPPRSLTQTGFCSSTRCRARASRSTAAELPSSRCTASRIQATFSARSTVRSSSTLKRVAVAQSNSMPRICR